MCDNKTHQPFDSSHFGLLREHVGHQLEAVTYGDPPVNVAVECIDCCQVPHSIDKYPENAHPKVYIIVRGGMVELVYSDEPLLGVALLDFDNGGTRDPDEMEELERMYDAIKKECCEMEYWEASEL